MVWEIVNSHVTAHNMTFKMNVFHKICKGNVLPNYQQDFKARRQLLVKSTENY